MSNKLKNIQFYLFLFLIFILPLSAVDFVLVRPLLFPAIALWIIASLLSLLLFTGLKDNFKLHAGMGLVIAYFTYEITRDILTVPILRALFGDARGPFLSVLTSLSLMILYLTASQFSYDQKARIKTIVTMVVSITVAGVLGILQHFGSITLFQPSVRAYSTLSNPIELAGISLLIVILISGLIIHKRWMYGFVPLVLLSFTVVSTQSKIGVFLLGLLLITMLLNAFRLRLFAVAAIFITVLIASLFVYHKPVDSEYEKRSSFAAAKLTGKDVASSMLDRQQTWRESILLGFANPLFGWGQADFPNIFTKFSGRNDTELIVFDVHNWILDAFAKGGIIKLILIAAIALYYLRNREHDHVNDYILLAIGLYMVYLLFNPSWLVSKVYFVCIIGLISVKLSERREFDPTGRSKIWVYSGMLCSLAFITFSVYSGVSRLNAEIISTKGVNASRSGSYDQGIHYSKIATKVFPYEPDYWSRLGWSHKLRYFQYRSENDLKAARSAYEQALSLIPNDVIVKQRITDLQQQINKTD